MMNVFRETFKIQTNAIPAPNSVIKTYKEKVPKLMIDLWTSDGFGKYNDGLFETVNPKDFESVLWTWLGQTVEHYVPFAISGFGELFYYRKLSETDEDVCMIDIQYRKIETVAWSLESFFERFLTSPKEREFWLRESLFKQVIFEQGVLPHNDIFTFAPILGLGGAEALEYLKKGHAQTYQNLVFEMTS